MGDKTGADGRSMGEQLDRRDFVRLGVGAGAGLGLAGSLVSAEGEEVAGESQDFFSVVSGRRSVRKFKATPVPEEHIMKILDAARLAPTAGNQQPWKFLVIRDRAKLDRLRDASLKRRLEKIKKTSGGPSDELASRTEAIRQHFSDYLSAPVYILVLTDSQSKYPDYNDKDGPLAAGYLMLAARALGYGTVFCTDTIPEDITREVLAIPERYRRVCITPLGVPDEASESPAKKELSELVEFESI